jgi:hypothetical protein
MQSDVRLKHPGKQGFQENIALTSQHGYARVRINNSGEIMAFPSTISRESFAVIFA